MAARVAIIGGTGVGEILAREAGTAVAVPTAFGLMRGRLAGDVLLVQRHSAGHKTPPHHVNYRAIADGLRRLGVQYCLSSAAVGSLREALPPGSLAVCHDFLDVSARNLTLYDRVVRHVDMSSFGEKARGALLVAARPSGTKEQAVYATLNGPRYETPSEIRALQTLGIDIVGMTAASEAILMREAGIEYACLAIVTNMGAGIEAKTLSHEEVGEMMRAKGELAAGILRKAAGALL